MKYPIMYVDTRIPRFLGFSVAGSAIITVLVFALLLVADFIFAALIVGLSLCVVLAIYDMVTGIDTAGHTVEFIGGAVIGVASGFCISLSTHNMIGVVAGSPIDVLVVVLLIAMILIIASGSALAAVSAAEPPHGFAIQVILLCVFGGFAHFVFYIVVDLSSSPIFIAILGTLLVVLVAIGAFVVHVHPPPAG